MACSGHKNLKEVQTCIEAANRPGLCVAVNRHDVILRCARECHQFTGGLADTVRAAVFQPGFCNPPSEFVTEGRTRGEWLAVSS